MSTANPTMQNPFRAALSFLHSVHPTDLLVQISIMVLVGTLAAWMLSGALGVFDSTATEQVLVGTQTGAVSRFTGNDSDLTASDALIDKAELAVAAEQFTIPQGQSALEYIDQSLALVPENPRARAMLDRVLGHLAERALDAIEQQQFAEAVSLIAPARERNPDHVQLKLIDRQLGAEKQRLIDLALRSARDGNFEEANTLLAAVAAASEQGDPALTAANTSIEQIRQQRQQQAARQAAAATAAAQSGSDAGDSAATEEPVADGGDEAAADEPDTLSASEQAQQVEDLVRMARLAMADERLVTPEQENALRYVSDLQDVAPSTPAVVEVTDELVARLVARARDEIGAGQFESADLWIGEARSLDDSSRLVRNAQQALDTAEVARESERVLALSDLDFAEYVPPEYPARARQRQLEGWVDVEFLVDVTGNITDVEILDAQRLQYFRDAAVEAIRSWQVNPKVVRGRTISQRVRTRIEFRIE